jgi:hypothetical protein
LVDAEDQKLYMVTLRIVRFRREQSESNRRPDRIGSLFRTSGSRLMDSMDQQLKAPLATASTQRPGRKEESRGLQGFAAVLASGQRRACAWTMEAMDLEVQPAGSTRPRRTWALCVES